MKFRFCSGLLCVALFALAGCKDFDPYQKVDYAQTAYDRHMKNGDITAEQRDIGMKPFNPQGVAPPVAQKIPTSTESPASSSTSSDAIPPPPSTAPNSPENSPPVVAPAATPTNWP